MDDPKFISDTFLLSIFAYNPLSSPTLILGTPKANVVLIFDEFKEPLHIPVIVGTADRVTLNPSPDTVSILLNLSTVSPSGVYLNIVPVPIPAKLKLPFVVAPAPVIVILSALLIFGAITRFKTVSDVKLTAYPVTELVFWKIPFTSCIPKVLTDFVDLINEVSSFIINCSPTMNSPVTSLKWIHPYPPETMETYPVAPLLTPLTKEVRGTSVLVTFWFNSIFVNIWTSNKCKSHSVESPVYDASDTANEYILASPILSPCFSLSAVVLLLYSSTSAVSSFIFGAGTPETWFTLNTVPIWYGTNEESTVFLSLGLSTSSIVDDSRDTS